jgi:ferric iron reductase protein FhuF
MPSEDRSETSPLVAVLHELRTTRSNWHVAIGQPTETGWITGTDLMTAREGPFHALLSRIGARLRTSDRRTIAASFALRYAWSSGVAIAPYILRHCVPKIFLDNISFKFHENTAFERVALHQPAGVMLRQEGTRPHPLIELLPSQDELTAWLRTSLTQQAQPIVEALYEWSGFSVRGTWGMITSSWGSQFMNICEEIEEQKVGLPYALNFFEGNDLVSQMKPDFYPVTYKNVTHIYHRRSSCCRYYKLPHGQYCASCPLVSQEERIQRNRDWMQYLLERQRP